MTSLWKIGVLLLFVAAVLPAVNIAYTDHSYSPTAENESMTVDYSGDVPVSESGHHYSDTVTITNDGTTLDNGTDYTWNATAGDVAFQNTSATNEGDTVRIDYDYYERTDTTALAGNVLTPWGLPVTLLLVFFVVYGGYQFAVSGGRGGGL